MYAMLLNNFESHVIFSIPKNYALFCVGLLHLKISINNKVHDNFWFQFDKKKFKAV